MSKFVVPQCPHCGSTLYEPITGTEAVNFCLDCENYFEDDSFELEYLRHKKSRVRDLDEWDD